MRQEGDVCVSWTRPELIALREAIEITPNFEGRADVREIVVAAMRAPRLRDVRFERELAQRFANRLVPVDMPTAMARAKLLTAVRGKRRRTMVNGATRRPPVPVPSPVRTAPPVFAVDPPAAAFAA